MFREMCASAYRKSFGSPMLGRRHDGELRTGFPLYGCRGPTPETHSCETSSDDNRLHPYRRTQEHCQLSEMASRRSQGLRRSEDQDCLSSAVRGHEGSNARHRKYASLPDWFFPCHRAVSAVHGVEPDEST